MKLKDLLDRRLKLENDVKAFQQLYERSKSNENYKVHVGISGYASVQLPDDLQPMGASVLNVALVRTLEELEKVEANIRKAEEVINE